MPSTGMSKIVIIPFWQRVGCTQTSTAIAAHALPQGSNRREKATEACVITAKKRQHFHLHLIFYKIMIADIAAPSPRSKRVISATSAPKGDMIGHNQILF